MKSYRSRMIRIIHGANEDWLPAVGQTISSVKRALRDVFNIPYFAEARVNGIAVNADHVVGEGAVLEFVRTFGHKGGESIGSEAEADGLLSAYQEELAAIGEQVKAMDLGSKESIDVTIQLVSHWCQKKFGALREVDLECVSEVCNRLAQLLRVSAEVQRFDAIGKPGRKSTTEDIAMFGHLRRQMGQTWKEVHAEWKRENPDDDRVKKAEDIREAVRRHYGDKLRPAAQDLG